MKQFTLFHEILLEAQADQQSTSYKLQVPFFLRRHNRAAEAVTATAPDNYSRHLNLGSNRSII